MRPICAAPSSDTRRPLVFSLANRQPTFPMTDCTGVIHEWPEVEPDEGDLGPADPRLLHMSMLQADESALIRRAYVTFGGRRSDA